jgi:hypothetical protein
MESMTRLQAINEAIWIRDNCERISRDLLIDRLQEISEYGLFSNRQLARICNNKVSHALIGQYTKKNTNAGGKIAPESLEDLREALFSKERRSISYPHVQSALEAGTSQGMVARITGINQSSISRKFADG